MNRFVVMTLIAMFCISTFIGCMLNSNNDIDDIYQSANTYTSNYDADLDSDDIKKYSDAIIVSLADTIIIDEYWNHLIPEVEELDGTEMLETIYYLSENLCKSNKTILVNAYDNQDFDYSYEQISQSYINPLIKYICNNKLDSKRIYDENHYWLKGNSEKEVYAVFICSLKECFSDYIFFIDYSNVIYIDGEPNWNNIGPTQKLVFLPEIKRSKYKDAKEFFDNKKDWTKEENDEIYESGYYISYNSNSIKKIVEKSN